MKNDPQVRTQPSPRILLVDDDAIFRSEFIAIFSDYAIAEAASGEEAIRVLQQPNEIDVIVLDVQMPGMDGIETMEKIKRSWGDKRVVISTGHCSKDLLLDALRAKADDFLEKADLHRTMADIIAKHVRVKEKLDCGEGIDGKIAQVKTYIRKNLDKKVSLEAAADRVCLSPKYLSRVFQARTHEKFNQYSLSLKIAHAKRLLEQTALSVEQIANSVGYLNAESLIRLFQKVEKVTPAEYRRSQARQKVQRKPLREKNVRIRRIKTLSKRSHAV